MEVRQLQTFCILAEELNFTRTAERVFTVQSNVTSQIKSLEAELGYPLFDRLAKRVFLTEAGRRFRPYAEKALAAMDEGYRAVKFGTEPAGPFAHLLARECADLSVARSAETISKAISQSGTYLPP